MKKKQRDREGLPANTRLHSRPKVKQVRTRGGAEKTVALRLREGNFAVPSKGIAARCTVKEILYNPAGIDLVRRGILTKGAIVRLNISPLQAKQQPTEEAMQTDLCISKAHA